MKKKQKILIFAGGTGGHIIPAKNIANLLESFFTLKNCPYQIDWVASNKSVDKIQVPNKYQPIYANLYLMRGISLIKKIINSILNLIELVKLTAIVCKIKPTLILTFGGYVGFFGAIISVLLRKDLFVFEQNANASLSNKIIAKFATKLFTTYPNSFGVNYEIEILSGTLFDTQFSQINLDIQTRYQSHDTKNLNLLILGGSQGSSFFNELIPQTLYQLNKKNLPNIKHQTGLNKIKQTQYNYQKFIKNQHSDLNIECFEIKQDLLKDYLWADIVIARAGALSVAEIQQIGIAAIFIPYPHAADNHQKLNVQQFADEKRCYVFEQKEINSIQLAKLLNHHTEQKQKNKLEELIEMAKKLHQTKKDSINIINQEFKKYFSQKK